MIYFNHCQGPTHKERVGGGRGSIERNTEGVDRRRGQSEKFKVEKSSRRRGWPMVVRQQAHQVAGVRLTHTFQKGAVINNLSCPFREQGNKWEEEKVD